MLRGKIKLGTTYITKIGEFTPVEYEKGKLKYKNGLTKFWANPKQRLEGRYIDANGRRLKRRNFIAVK